MNERKTKVGHIWEKIRKNPLETVLALLLLIQVGLIAASNLFLMDKNIDCDNAKMLNHIIKIWEEKNWTIPQWSYVSTLEWDCTTLFAVPLYGLTKNIYLACALSNIFFVLCLIAVLFSCLQMKRNYILCSAQI